MKRDMLMLVFSSHLSSCLSFQKQRWWRRRRRRRQEEKRIYYVYNKHEYQSVDKGEKGWLFFSFYYSENKKILRVSSKRYLTTWMELNF